MRSSWLDPFFNRRRNQLVQLAARHALPASYPVREFCRSRRTDERGTIVDAWRQVGVYSGREGENAGCADKFDLVINLKTANLARPAEPAHARR